ncbi:hypothetical protein [Pleionea sediminis]|uniref:hypothetical protein n=1 Tax=Pleionea sediminis TaxID=2569479 RepID=UPI001186D552|nr:hypothetical protein [Pleionea sediminis]
MLSTQWRKTLIASLIGVAGVGTTFADSNYPQSFNSVALYGVNSDTFLSTKTVSVDHARYELDWIKMHQHHVLGNLASPSQKFNIYLETDADNNQCISSGDSVSVQDLEYGLYLGYRGSKNVYGGDLRTYTFVSEDAGCLSGQDGKTFQLQSGDNYLIDSSGGQNFQLFTGIENVIEQPITNYRLTYDYNDSVSILTYFSAFLSRDGAFIPTVNRDGEKWQFFGDTDRDVLRNYCIPEGTVIRMKNMGRKQFVQKNDHDDNMHWSDYGTRFEIKNRSYPGECVEAKDRFSLQDVSTNKYLSVSHNRYDMFFNGTYDHKRNNFVFSSNPDMDFHRNRADLTIAVSEFHDFHRLPDMTSFHILEHDGNMLDFTENTYLWGVDADLMSQYRAAGTVMQYSYHTTRFQDDSFFYLKRDGSGQHDQFLGATTTDATKIKTDRPWVQNWESLRFEFNGPDDGQEFDRNSGTTQGFSNQIRLWDPDLNRWGMIDTKVTGINDGYIQADTDRNIGLRFYFSAPKQDHITSLNVTALKTRNNKYVMAENNGGGEVNAAALGFNEWENIQFVPVNRSASGRRSCLKNNDQVYLRTNNGHLYIAYPDGRVAATSTNYLEWERFTIINHSNSGCLQHGDSISLRTHHGNLLEARDNDVVQTPLLTLDTRFTLMLDTAVFKDTFEPKDALSRGEVLEKGQYLISENNEYIAFLDQSGNFKLAKGSSPQNIEHVIWERFGMFIAPQYVSISGLGKLSFYGIMPAPIPLVDIAADKIVITNNGQLVLTDNARQKTIWSSAMETLPETLNVSLQIADGRYVNLANNQNKLEATGLSIGNNEKFALAHNDDRCVTDGEVFGILSSNSNYWTAYREGQAMDSGHSGYGGLQRFSMVNRSSSLGCMMSGDTISIKTIFNTFVQANTHEGSVLYHNHANHRQFTVTIN